jgi:hypothetical protein
MIITSPGDDVRPDPMLGDNARLERKSTFGLQAAGDDGDDSAEDADNERYRLISIEIARTPKGCSGRDWFVYRIAQGQNAITGYRRGNRDMVSRDVATIVAALNGRRRWTKKKSDAKARRRGAPRTTAE